MLCKEYRLGVNRRDCEYRAGVANLISAIRTVVKAKISLLNKNTSTGTTYTGIQHVHIRDRLHAL